MSRDQLAQRLLSLDSSVGINRLRKGGLTPDEWDRIATAAGELYNAQIFVDESSAITVQQIKAKVRRNKPDVVFIDYLQLLTAVTKSDNRAVQVQEMTRDLKIMAKEPVSYTHLDVYKRQLRRWWPFGGMGSCKNTISFQRKKIPSRMGYGGAAPSAPFRWDSTFIILNLTHPSATMSFTKARPTGQL